MTSQSLDSSVSRDPEDARVVPATVLRSLIADLTLNHTAMRYYSVVAAEPMLTLEQVADRMDCSTKTARRARTALLEGGWLELIQITGANGVRSEHRCRSIPEPKAS
jgi:hypothetical protein